MNKFKLKTGSTTTRVLTGAFLGIATVATVYTVGFRNSTTQNLGNAVSQLASCNSCSISGQNAPTDGQKVISLMAGESYDFNTIIAPGTTVKWRAMVGQIDDAGLYTAPSFLPPASLDSVEFTDSQGNFVQIDLHIRANPMIPDSNFPKFVRKTGAQISSGGGLVNGYELIGGAQQAVLATGTLEDVLPNDGRYLPILEPGEVYDSPSEVAECQNLEIKNPVTNEKEVPEDLLTATDIERAENTSVRGLGTDAVILVEGQPVRVEKGPMECMVKPKNPWPVGVSKDCTGSGWKRVEGRIKKFTREETSQTSQMTITTEIAGKVEAVIDLGGSVGVTISVSRTMILYRDVMTDDLYQCVDGKWVFKRREICERSASGERAAPFWVAIADGYPTDGGPRLPYGPWSCH